MKVIFVIQGEGRGHLTQALALKQMLLHEGHEVVKVLVGKSKNRVIPEFSSSSILLSRCLESIPYQNLY